MAHSSLVQVFGVIEKSPHGIFCQDMPELWMLQAVIYQINDDHGQCHALGPDPDKMVELNPILIRKLLVHPPHLQTETHCRENKNHPEITESPPRGT